MSVFYCLNEKAIFNGCCLAEISPGKDSIRMSSNTWGGGGGGCVSDNSVVKVSVSVRGMTCTVHDLEVMGLNSSQVELGWVLLLSKVYLNQKHVLYIILNQWNFRTWNNIYFTLHLHVDHIKLHNLNWKGWTAIPEVVSSE